MKIFLAFFTSLGIGIGSLFGYLTLTASDPPETQVLSANIQASPSPTSTLTPQPSNSPTPTPIPSDTPTSTPTKTPTPIPTRVPSPRPSASPTMASTPSPIPSPTPTKTPTPIPTPTATLVGTTPTSTPTAMAPAHLEPFFVQYSTQYNVDKNLLEKIAKCESSFNPNAVNGDYLGIFQFSSSTWSTKRGLMGLDSNPALRTNAEESIRTAAFTINRDGTYAWQGCL